MDGIRTLCLRICLIVLDHVLNLVLNHVLNLVLDHVLNRA